jgi:hypothetical protein
MEKWPNWDQFHRQELSELITSIEDARTQLKDKQPDATDEDFRSLFANNLDIWISS